VMAESKMASIARERVDDLALRNGEPSWLKDSRLGAWELYLQKPLPTVRDEDWRKTEVESLDLSVLTSACELKAAAAPHTWSTLDSAIAKLGKPAGLFVDDYSQTQSKFVSIEKEVEKSGVLFMPIKEMLEKHGALAEKIFAKTSAAAKDDKFTLMNKALFNTGYVLYVPAKVVVEAPFVSAVNVVASSSQAIFPRLVVVAEAGSQVNLVNVFSSTTKAGESGSSTLVNSLLELHIGPQAHVTLVTVDDLSGDVFAVNRVTSRLHKDSNFFMTTAGLGGRQIKSDIETIMVEPGSNSDIRGVVLGDGTEHFSYNTIQEHACPDTTSNINFRVALKDHSASIYQGIVKVDKIAQRTNAFQSNKNLLLGTEARADSIPKLEILADDVKCSHGATVGPVDKEQLFYLTCRGLSAPEAEELIVLGFFAQILDGITVKGAAEWVGELVADKIQKDHK
jgi:Fe-S cluster assembly protein SufD